MKQIYSLDRWSTCPFATACEIYGYEYRADVYTRKICEEQGTYGILSLTFTLCQQVLLTPLKFQTWSMSRGCTLPALSTCVYTYKQFMGYATVLLIS
jgi:hypothetical protein